MLNDIAAKVGKAMEEWHEAQTPADGNICKTSGCGGRVVEKVAGSFRGKYFYHSPACEKCGRFYRHAKGCARVGEKEFRKSLNEAVTI